MQDIGWFISPRKDLRDHFHISKRSLQRLGDFFQGHTIKSPESSDEDSS